MKIFPIGNAIAASNQGALNGVSYSMFEPNLSCKSTSNHNILQTKFQDQTRVTRKKSAPVLQITYNYDSIFTKEFRQIERSIMDVDDSLTPIFIVDFSRGLSPSTIASAANKWSVNIDDTYFYSATAGFRANRALLWNGRAWKEGAITGLTLNASITVDIRSNNFGALPLGDAGEGMVYPLYETYMAGGSLQSFEPGEYWQEDITTGEPGGYMYTGNINFVSRYKV